MEIELEDPLLLLKKIVVAVLEFVVMILVGLIKWNSKTMEMVKKLHLMVTENSDVPFSAVTDQM